MRLDSIFAITEQYDTFLVDVWGVVYDGVHPLVEGVKALNKLKQQGKTIIFVSNNPRPSNLARATLQQLGIEGTINIVTSGDVMRSLLQAKHPGQKVYHLGRARNKDLLSGINLIEVDTLDESDFVILSCFLEETEDFSQFDPELEHIAKQHMLVYCPNPDIHAAHENTLRKTAGFFARRLEEKFGGQACRIGKPNAIIFDFVNAQFPEILQDKRKALMIGDTLTTDIQGGHDYGIDTLLVEDGISGLLREHCDTKPTYTIKILK